MNENKDNYHSKIIDRFSRNIDLRTTMRVGFWFDWIDKHVDHGRGHTEQENIEAWYYADTQTYAYFNSISHATEYGGSMFIHFKDGTSKETKIERFKLDYPHVELR